jgi:hypothetical protein
MAPDFRLIAISTSTTEPMRRDLLCFVSNASATTAVDALAARREKAFPAGHSIPIAPMTRGSEVSL